MNSLSLALAVVLAMPLVAVAVASRVDLPYVIFAIGVGLLSSSGLSPGSLGPAYILVMGGTVLVLSKVGLNPKGQEARLPTLSAWLVGPVVLLAGAFALNLFFPAGLDYLGSRYAQSPASFVASSQLLALLKWAAAILGVPTAIALVCNGSMARLRGLLWAWLVGAAVNALVAISDYFGVTSVSAQLPTTAESANLRTAGLTSQPNQLACVCAMAIPVALMLAVAADASRRHRWLGLSTTALLVGGVIVSGSRGGLLAAVVAGFLALCQPAARPLRRGATLLLVLASPLLLSPLAALLQALSQGQRVTGVSAGLGAASDQGRALLRHQAWLDFLHSPIHGIGSGVLTSAHEAHLQVLAATGLVGAVAMLWLFGGVASAVRREFLTSRNAVQRQLIWACIGAIVAWLTMMFVNNQLVDAYLYVPIAVAAAVERGGIRPLPVRAGTRRYRKEVASLPPIAV